MTAGRQRMTHGVTYDCHRACLDASDERKLASSAGQHPRGLRRWPALELASFGDERFAAPFWLLAIGVLQAAVTVQTSCRELSLMVG